MKQVPPYKRLRVNQEEVHLQGNEGHGDLRVMNSYPSKIGMPSLIKLLNCLSYLSCICLVNSIIQQLKGVRLQRLKQHYSLPNEAS